MVSWDAETQKTQALIKCIEDGGTLYNPKDKVQNHIIGALMEKLVYLFIIIFC